MGDGPFDGVLGEWVGVSVGFAVGVGRTVGRGEWLAKTAWFGLGVGEDDGTGEAAGATEQALAATTIAAIPIRAVDRAVMDPP